MLHGTFKLPQVRFSFEIQEWPFAGSFFVVLCSIALRLLLRFAVVGYVDVMLAEAFGEAGVSGAVGDKVECVGRRWIEHSAQGSGSG